MVFRMNARLTSRELLSGNPEYMIIIFEPNNVPVTRNDASADLPKWRTCADRCERVCELPTDVVARLPTFVRAYPQHHP